MGEAVTLSTKGQVVVPKAVRDRLGWRTGARLVIEERGDHLILRGVEDVPRTTVEDLLGCAGYSGPARSLKEMDRAIAQEVRRRFRKGEYS